MEVYGRILCVSSLTSQKLIQDIVLSYEFPSSVFYIICQIDLYVHGTDR